MIYKIKKTAAKNLAAWLILSVMVLCMAAGCSVTGTVQADKTAQSVLTSPDTGAADEPATEVALKAAAKPGTEVESDAGIDEGGSYTTKDEVALYLHTYGRLPDNYITKKEAQNLGWDSKKGNLTEVAPGKSIGGSHFGNYEGQLPENEGRRYYECDLDYDGGYRGGERIIYSDDGLIFYTGDHYKTFEQLY